MVLRRCQWVLGPWLFSLAACGEPLLESDSGDLDSVSVGGVDAGTERSDAAESDGGRPVEVCNLIDDDMDMRVDEPPACAEALAHGVCVEGRCVCHDLRTPAAPGDFGDCNGDFADGCETPLDTRVDCGGCGVRCGVTEACTAVDGAVACRSGILDFSVADEGGQITCIVTEDNRVVCRGDNASHALADDLEESAVLDWMELDVPLAREVHSSRVDHGDGTSGLSVCVVTLDRAVLCRGDNTTGLLGQGHTRPLAGTWPIPISGPVAQMVSWNGEAIAGATSSRLTALWRWGGRGWARAPENVGSGRDWRLSIGDMVSVYRLWGSGEELGAMWGPHRSYLAGLPDSAPPWVTPTGVTPVGACHRGVCCSQTRCWGGRPYDDERGGIDVPRSIVDPHGYSNRPERDCPLPYSNMGEENYAVSVLLGEDGRERVCRRVCYGHATESRAPPGHHWRIACGDVETVLAAETTVLEIVPEMTLEDERYARSRVDWQAMCVQHRPDWWECWGSHTGWNNPPRD